MDTNVQKAVAILRAGGSLGDESVRITQVVLTKDDNYRDVKFSIFRQRRQGDGQWIDDENPLVYISELLRPFSLDVLKAAAREVFGPNAGVMSVF